MKDTIKDPILSLHPQKPAVSLPYMAYLFVVGSLCGFCIEVVFRSACTGALTIPGFLYGPYLPIYGCAMLIIPYLCSHKNPLAAFAEIFVYSTLLEYVVSWFFERMFHQLLWDYSMMPLHLGTRVSLVFSLAWGGIGMAVLYLAEPLLHEAYFRHTKGLRLFTSAVLAVMAVDTVFSVAAGL